MSKYAFVDPSDNILYYRNRNEIDPAVDTKPGYRWLIVDVVIDPIDEITQVRLPMVRTIEPTRVLEYYGVRNKTAREITEMKLKKIDEIKKYAYDLIVGLMPEYKQRNSLAYASETVILYGTDRNNWPSEMQIKWGQDSNTWNIIKNIRTESDMKEANVNLLTLATDIASYNVANNWPEGSGA